MEQAPEHGGDERFDVVVVGGGAAGLSAALALGRSRRSVLVVDAGQPRNATAGHVHNYLGREGTPPAELMAVARTEVEACGVRVEPGRASAASALPAGPRGEDGGVAGFRVDLYGGRSVLGRRLVVTTGLVDQLPPVPGVAERWGRDVLHCPYCHGWEVRDQAIGVLATGAPSVHQALLFRQLSADVTLLTHTAGSLGEEQLEQLAARGIPVVDGEVASLRVDGDRLSGVALATGAVVPLQVLVVAPFFRASADLLTPLGVGLEEVSMGTRVVATRAAADPTGATGVPGVWVAGNVTNPQAQVISSAAAGLATGAAVNAELVAEDTRRAVAASRAALAGAGSR